MTNNFCLFDLLLLRTLTGKKKWDWEKREENVLKGFNMMIILKQKTKSSRKVLFSVLTLCILLANLIFPHIWIYMNFNLNYLSSVVLQMKQKNQSCGFSSVGLMLGTHRPSQLSCTLLHVTLSESEECFLKALHCFTTCHQLWDSLSSEAEESQKRSRAGRLAAGIFAAVSLRPVHAGPRCYRELLPWHEQALTAVRSVLLPDRRHWGFEDCVI